MIKLGLNIFSNFGDEVCRLFFGALRIQDMEQ